MEDEKNFNRRNVDNIKRGIVVLLALVCAIPVMFCLYLTYKMNTLENKMENLSNQIAEASESTVAEPHSYGGWRYRW